MSARTFEAIIGFHLVTVDLPRLVGFYRDILGFAMEDEGPISGEEMRLLGLSGGGRRQRMRLGRETVCIDQFEAPGRPYPEASDAASLWFQHLALVTDDMTDAHARLREIAPITEGGPQLLPQSSGGVRAFKFRDPDGHPLELVQFPADKVPEHWKQPHPLGGQIGLGIDHSAISVADVETSVAFYGANGLSAGDRTHNRGEEQQRLDDLRGVDVEVVPMLPGVAPPHLELLGYQVSRGNRGPALMANDVAATRILWRGPQAGLLRDPDGHLQQIASS